MSRPICPAALAIIRGDESCRLVAYQDSVGVWTIGWGHTGPEVHEGLVWTQAQADAQLQQDVAEHADQVENAIGTVPTTDNQFGAMVSLAYNIGIGNFRKSSVLRCHCEGNFVEAKDSFALWDEAGGVVLNGLVKRRAQEAELYGTP